MNVADYNREAWNRQSREGCRWSTPFPGEVVERAKAGDWSVALTPNRPVPPDWFPSWPDLSGVRILALASGGGQQVPVFAAAGAEVTSFDNSDVQLEKDRETCLRHGLAVATVQGDMADLGGLAEEAFDLVFNPVSNVFAPALGPVWEGCRRALAPGGRLLCGFMNPVFFLFDHEHLEATGELRGARRLPCSDLDPPDPATLDDQLESMLSLEFSHSWEEQIGGQCRAGFAVTGFYEDDWDAESTRLHGWTPLFAATCARRAGAAG